MKYLKNKPVMALWKVILMDLVVLGIILLVFATFHHVLPKYLAEYRLEQEILSPTEPVPTVPVQTEPPATEAPGVAETEKTTEPPTEPDPRTPWQIKFEDKFTDEVVITENSYSSPEISITIDKVTDTIDKYLVTYYVADIYVAGMENFKTHLAYDKFSYYGDQNGIQMAKDVNAILAINGDFATVHKSGFIVRNGNVYLSDLNKGICAMYPDGTMEAFSQGSYQVEDILAKEPVHVWSFGPSLLDENGKAMETYELANGIGGRHPRCGVGYYEPGHYCFILVDGRQNGYSNGMSIPNLAKLFEGLGCELAYNLDGGRSAVMMFQQKFHSKPYLGGRDLGDILYIAESGLYTQSDRTAETEAQEVTE